MSSSLESARKEEARLRSRLAEAVAEQRAADQEAARLIARADLDGATEDMRDAADRQRSRASRLATEAEEIRRDLRVQEGVVARLEADADGA